MSHSNVEINTSPKSTSSESSSRPRPRALTIDTTLSSSSSKKVTVKALDPHDTSAFPPPPPRASPPASKTSSSSSRSKPSPPPSTSPPIQSLFPTFPGPPLVSTTAITKKEIVSSPQPLPPQHNERRDSTSLSAMFMMPESSRASRRGSALISPPLEEERSDYEIAVPEKASSSQDAFALWDVLRGERTLCDDELKTLTFSVTGLTSTLRDITLRVISEKLSEPVYRFRLVRNGTFVTRCQPHCGGKSEVIAQFPWEWVSKDSTRQLQILPEVLREQAFTQAHEIARSNGLSSIDTTRLVAESIIRARETQGTSIVWSEEDELPYTIRPPFLNNSTNLKVEGLNPVRMSLFHVPQSSNARVRLITLFPVAGKLQIDMAAIFALPLSSTDSVIETLLTAFLSTLVHRDQQASAYRHRSGAPSPSFAPPPTLFRSHARESTYSSIVRPLAAFRPWSSRRETSISTTLYGDKGDASSTIELKALESGQLRTRTQEFDVEHGLDLSRFQTFDVSDPALPRVVRTTLGILYWLFEALVWCQGTGVSVIAAVIVMLGTCGRMSRDA